MNKYLIPVVILAIVVGGALYFSRDTVVVNNPDQLGAVASPDIQSPWTCHAGICTWSSNGSFADATTTIVSILNPTGSDAVVDLVMLSNSGVATTSYSIACGTSTTAYAAPAASIISSQTVGTSTLFKLLVSGDSASTTSFISGGTVSKLRLKSTDYLLCKANTAASDYDTAFTDVTNTFAGRYSIRWLWSR